MRLQRCNWKLRGRRDRPGDVPFMRSGGPGRLQLGHPSEGESRPTNSPPLTERAIRRVFTNWNRRRRRREKRLPRPNAQVAAATEREERHAPKPDHPQEYRPIENAEKLGGRRTFATPRYGETPFANHITDRKSPAIEYVKGTNRFGRNRPIWNSRARCRVGFLPGGWVGGGGSGRGWPESSTRS